MNRRNFFSLALLSLGAMVANKVAAFLPPVVGKSSIFDLEPLNLGQMRQAHMLARAQCPSHSHGINDPGHSHNILDNGHWHTIEPAQGVKVNPNWIPAQGQWIWVEGRKNWVEHYIV